MIGPGGALYGRGLPSPLEGPCSLGPETPPAPKPSLSVCFCITAGGSSRALGLLGSRSPSHLLAQGLYSLTGTSLSSVPEACSAGLEERGKEQRVRPGRAATPAAELGRFLSPVVWQGPLQTPAAWVPSLTP